MSYLEPKIKVTQEDIKDLLGKKQHGSDIVIEPENNSAYIYASLWVIAIVIVLVVSLLKFRNEVEDFLNREVQGPVEESQGLDAKLLKKRSQSPKDAIIIDPLKEKRQKKRFRQKQISGEEHKQLHQVNIQIVDLE